MIKRIYIKEDKKDINELINDIKNFIIYYYGFDSYEEFIDNQSIGECQDISDTVYENFKQFGVKHVFGEIELDEPYLDDNQEEQILMTHHWNTFGKNILDFSKGTLSNYIDDGLLIKYDP